MTRVKTPWRLLLVTSSLLFLLAAAHWTALWIGFLKQYEFATFQWIVHLPADREHLLLAEVYGARVRLQWMTIVEPTGTRPRLFRQGWYRDEQLPREWQQRNHLRALRLPEYRGELWWTVFTSALTDSPSADSSPPVA